MTHQQLPDFATPSFETTIKDVQQFTAVADRMPAGAPINLAFVEDRSVDDRLAAVDALSAAGLTTRPILSARRIASEAELVQLLEGSVAKRGIRELFIAGGDPTHPVGPYGTALELIQSEPLASAELELIGLPGFPQQHPEVTVETLLDHLVEKVEAIETSGRRAEITTQVCLDPDALHAWITQLRDRGVTAPIRIGIPAPVAAESLLRFCRMCKLEVTHDDLVRHGWLPDDVSMVADPAAFIDTLAHLLVAEHGEVAVHVYPMGDVPSALEWLSQL